MPFILEYSLKFSISLAFVYLFYAGLLRRLTFYHWNRWYLLLYSAIAFLIAFVDISPFIHQNELETSQVIQFIPLFDNYKAETTVIEIKRWTIWDWTLICFVIGTLIMLVRLAIQYFSITRIRSKAKLLLDQPIKVYQVDANIIPFSFGNSIFINQDLHAEEELKEIIRHEFIHIRQRHSIDMIWGEVLCIFNWYNPFAWLIRRSIRQNLEFIADDKVLKNGVDRKQYQYLLLKVIGVSQFSIANQFNFSSLKKRIVMMNKMRSARLQLVKFLFVIPLVLILLLAFRRQQQIQDTIHLSGTTRDTIPDKYKELPKEFKRIQANDSIVTITLQNGKKEVYNLNSARDHAEFKNKYNRSLESIMPPPPPPPPSGVDKVPPVPGNDKSIPPPPPPPAPPVKNLPDAINDVEVKEFTVIIKRKDGKTETYDLKVKGDLSKFEDKYGRRLEDMVPCEPVIIDAPGTKPILPAPTKQSLPGNESLPSKESLPSNKPAPVKPGVKPSPTIPAPTKAGAVPITTMNGDVNELKIDASLNGPGSPNKSGRVIMRSVNDPFANPLIIIDGRESPAQNIRELSIDPDHIESISIFKGESATKAYGEKGRNGVIIITTKNPRPAIKDTTKYRDVITNVERKDNQLGLKEWRLIKETKGKKVFLVDKKFLTEDEKEFENWVSKNEIHLIEFNTNQNDLRKYNIEGNGGIINAITAKNKDIKEVYLAPPTVVSPEMMDKIHEEARKRNSLFIGIKNPIAVKVEDVDLKNIVVKMDGSDEGVVFENGVFNIIPRNGAMGNARIDIYKKNPNGSLTLLNTRYFRIERLPSTQNFLTT